MATQLTPAETTAATTSNSHLPQVTEPRNPGMPLDRLGALGSGQHLCG